MNEVAACSGLQHYRSELESWRQRERALTLYSNISRSRSKGALTSAQIKLLQSIGCVSFLSPPSSDSRNPFYHDPATWYANKTPPPHPLPLTVSLEAVAAVDVSDAELVPLVVFDIRLETVKYSVPSNYNQVKVDNNSQVDQDFDLPSGFIPFDYLSSSH
uniref:Uncharacterized protein n=1 Tax=Daphnia galeata TaxID=27404 RepID=A0A8J2REL8_9CRUS|nr:unnamed protein product [Daphnia galeata]